MNELMRAALRLPWAIGMLGLQQLPDLVRPQDGWSRAAHGLDAVSRSAELQLHDAVLDWYRAGDGVQRALLTGLRAFDLPGLANGRNGGGAWAALRKGLCRSCGGS